MHLDRPRRGLDDMEFATLDRVDWLHHRRLLGSIGDIPPAEFEAMYYPEEETKSPADLRWTRPSEPPEEPG